MNILITGGAGYLGSVLVNKLLAANTSFRNKTTEEKKKGHTIWAMPLFKVTVYDNLMYKQEGLTDLCYRGDFEFVYGDVRDIEKLKPYIEEADVIIPLAAIVGAPACDKDKDLATQINTDQVLNILKYKQEHCKVIYPNTNSGYGVGEQGVHCTEDSPLNPISHYGKTKCAAEQAILEAGGVTLRLATVFGASPRMRLDLLVNDFVYKAMTDGYIVLFEGHFKRNYIHVQDVALTFVYCILNYDKLKSKAYNVGLSTANISKNDLALKVQKYIPKFSIQSDAYAQDIDKRDYIVSNARLENTGWNPYYTLDDGIQELIKAYSIIIPSNNKHKNI